MFLEGYKTQVSKNVYICKSDISIFEDAIRIKITLNGSFYSSKSQIATTTELIGVTVIPFALTANEHAWCAVVYYTSRSYESLTICLLLS